MTKKQLAIYVHIPFCQQKCLYCAFVSFVGSSSQQAYFDELKNQIALTEQSIIDSSIITSVYFGGGTPTAVPQAYVCNVLNQLKSMFTFSSTCEISLECNPNSTTKQKLLAYKKAGFNRISFGVQSFDNAELKAVGRLHTAAQAEKAVVAAKQVGFDNISIDLLIGIPHQTKNSLRVSVLKALALPITHLSAYDLILEEHTPLHKLIKQGKITLPTQDDAADSIELLEAMLSEHGFAKYEVSSFCKPNYECNQNQTYWRCNNYLAFGVAAHGYYDQERTENTPNLQAYLQGNYVKSKQKVGKTEQTEERIMLGLRMAEGIDLKRFETDFGFCLLQTKQAEIAKLEQLGLITHSDNHLKATQKGFMLLNHIILQLV